MGILGLAVGFWTAKKSMDVMKVKNVGTSYSKATGSTSKKGIDYAKETNIGGA